MDKSGNKSQDNTQFLYLLKEGKSIVAGLDMQIIDNETASIGFWQDVNKSGYMTNSVLRLIEDARIRGLKVIDAYVDLDNLRAMNVLKRTGFSYKGVVEGKTRPLKKFVLFL